MLLPIPKDVLEAQARDRIVDAWLGSLGVSAAVVSASFAAYMFATAPSDRSAHRDAAIAALGRPPARAARLVAPPQQPAAEAIPAEANGIDFEPTGSISRPSDGRRGAAEMPAKSVLPDFAVRDAFDGTALVEAHGTLQMVQPGAVIEGAGVVQSITRRGRGWVVATTEGLILQRR